MRRERYSWWQLVSQLFTPCSDQAVSLAQCVRESRPCPACLPGARLLADKIRGGLSATQAQGAYGVRFGPNVEAVNAADSPARGPADDRAEADRTGLQGTPFIVINGREFDLGLFSLQGELES